MIKNIFSKLALSSLLILSLINIAYAADQGVPPTTGCGDAVPCVQLPEPGMWALFLIGGLAFALNKWRRK